MTTSRWVYFSGFLLCITAWALARFYFQQHLELEPCPLCLIQRGLVIVVGALMLLGLLFNPGVIPGRILGGLVTIAAGVGAAVAGRHIWLQSLPADQVPSCGADLSFMLQSWPIAKVAEEVFKGSGECAEVSWAFLGLSIPAWTLILFAVLVLLGLTLLFQRRRRDFGLFR